MSVAELTMGLFKFTASRAQQKQPIPLLGVQVSAEITGMASQVVIRQRFQNQEDIPVEAVYVFPLPEAAALTSLVIETQGRRVVGKVQEREQAFETYDDAVAEGHGAVLVDEERPNVFTVSVGNILPNQEVVVEMQWVAELPVSGEALRFVLPTTVAPRFASWEDQLGVSPTPAERVNPPLALDVPYGWSSPP